jgi:hypothetical protein
MGVAEILASIDREIAVLEQARALLADPSVAARSNKVSVAVPSAAAKPELKRKKRKLSPEGRKRIAEAVKRRWETQRKAAASK